MLSNKQNFNAMKEETANKKEWISPEILDLDVDKSAKIFNASEKGDSTGPS